MIHVAGMLFLFAILFPWMEKQVSLTLFCKMGIIKPANSMAAGRFTVSGRKRRRKCQRGVLCGTYEVFVGV